MADSWEESEDIVLAPAPKPTLRADAPSFSFNPGASKFSPVSFAPPAQRAAGGPPGFASAAVVPDAQQQAAPPPPPAVRPQADRVMEDAQPVQDDAAMEPEAEREAPGQLLLTLALAECILYPCSFIQMSRASVPSRSPLTSPCLHLQYARMCLPGSACITVAHEDSIIPQPSYLISCTQML